MEKGIQGDMQWRRGLGQMPLPVETPLPVLSSVLFLVKGVFLSMYLRNKMSKYHPHYSILLDGRIFISLPLRDYFFKT